MFGSIQVVKSGDTIKDVYLDARQRLTVEKGPGVKVGKIEFDACSKKGVHINGRECYDGTAQIWVERGSLMALDEREHINTVDFGHPKDCPECVAIEEYPSEGYPVELSMSELFPDPWEQTIATAQRLVGEEKIAVKPVISPAQVYTNLVNQGMVSKSDMEQRLLQSLRVQGASSFGR